MNAASEWIRAFNLAVVLQGQNRLAEADAAYREALRLNPDHPETHYNHGYLLDDLQRPVEAEAAWREAIRLRPEYPEAWSNLGYLLRGQNRDDEAEAAWREAIRIRPDFIDARVNLGGWLMERGRTSEAQEQLRAALRADPACATAHAFLARLLHRSGDTEEAAAHWREALRIRPDDADGLYNFGNLLKDMGRRDEAEAAWRQAVRIRPDFCAAWNNLGNLLSENDRFPEAEAAWREAIRLCPDFVDAYYNLGNRLHRHNRLEESEAVLQAALRLHPGHAEASWSLGLLYLTQGRFAEGWPLYEYRYHPEREVPLPVPEGLRAPQWRGEALTGLTLLVLGEQGFGDEIQFCRYLPLLLERGVGRVIYVCRWELRAWFATLPGVELVKNVIEATGYDRWTFLLSIPLHLGTTLDNLPAGLPYLGTLPERDAFWRERLPVGGFRVGLIWKGSASHLNDANRSLPGLTVLAPLWRIPGVSFVTLQKGAGEEEALATPRQPLFPTGEKIRDFADTASIITQLDLVIGVDTAALHACGALAKPCLLLLPAIGSDWRWLAGDASPWYPGVMRLLRQERAGDWSGVVEAAAMEVAQRVLERLDETPENAVPCNDLGNLLAEGNRHDEAEAAYRKAIRADAGYVNAHYNLGLLLNTRQRFAEAEAAWRETIRLAPDHAPAWLNLGSLLHGRGRAGEAEAAYREVIRLGVYADNACYNLGLLLQETNRPDEAEAAYRETLRINPAYVAAHANLGVLLYLHGRSREAEAASREAIRLHPGHVASYANLATILMAQCRFDEGEEMCQRALAIDPGCLDAMTNWLFALVYHPDKGLTEIFDRYREFDARFVRPLRQTWRPHVNRPDPERVLRIGYLSPDFRKHSIQSFHEPLLANHDKRQVEIYAYADLAREDEVTARYQGYVDHWVPVRGWEDAVLAERIRADGIDILVDLAGHTFGNRLLVFARQPAPVSVTWQYSFTTGVSAIDYTLTDALADPPGAEAFHLERLWRVEAPALAYRPAEGMGAVGPLPALRRGYVTFGSFGRFIRVNHRVVRAWAAILRRVPGARLVIYSLSFRDQDLQERIIGQFAAHGIAPERLEIGFAAPPWEMLRGLDIGLDCFPFNSGITIAETLYMGVPAISLRERLTGVGQGGMFLRMLGHPEWVAATEEEYVEKAVALAADLPRLAELRAGQRARMERSPLMDEAGFACKIERAYREMWRRWCDAREYGTLKKRRDPPASGQK
ncbi:MAG: tetratricopeptide repeat protein [Magnetococcales bacterium]|nr:tetratricopeptide repeat protein [Magnetococcales bacterium]